MSPTTIPIQEGSSKTSHRSRSEADLQLTSAASCRGEEGLDRAEVRSRHPEDPEVLLTVADVMRLAKFGRTKVWAALRSGALASIKLGRSRRIRVRAYQHWIGR